MKKIININLAGRLIAIEDSAYEILRQYLESLSRYFAREEGGDEIVSDIESRIAELFLNKLKTTHCITDEDVHTVKASMGTPEQFDQAEEGGKQHVPPNDPVADYVRPRKRLYRDPDSKVLGGVCGGLGAYLNVDPVVFRIIFALLAIGGFGSGILVYFILWVVTPEANTAAEKLQMRGERVDVNNIRAAVQDEINSAKGQFKNIGNDFKNFSQGRGRQVGNDIERAFRNIFQALGKVLLLLTKGFFYFLAVVILLALIGVGIGITASSAALFPLKNLVLSGTLQNLLFWGSILFLIGIPIVALITFFVRKATGIKEANRYVGYTLSLLWFTGLICAFALVASLIKDFRAGEKIKENYALVQPSTGKLVIKQADDYIGIDDIDFFGDALRLTEDTVIINSARIRLEKSDSNEFEVIVERYSRGRTMSKARMLASEIQYKLVQQDSILYVPSGISIPVNSKFRGQHIRVVVKVPANKRVMMDKNLEYNNSWDYNDEDQWDNWGRNHDRGHVEIKMNEDGSAEDMNRRQETNQDNENRNYENKTDSLERNYRYKGGKQENKTPVEDSGSGSTPVGRTSEAALDAVSMISYSLYKLVK
ncbi:PspC domain-containing protein [Chitinophaga rhizophila]|uniref:PspC domain-containing protein n=1 Tax=Chitinophaga rhizophila TaxID=2866212 RepID=A0ABS7GEN8_9BACT|nr:PspC domain-containing protein [Chitinophaga rhizophila]MBW8686139.1 PspC domain-containing protein [Chitinophaga rhizophila]